MNWLSYRLKTGLLGIKALVDARRSGHRRVTVDGDEYRFVIDSTAAAWELRFVHELERPFYEAILDEIDEETVFYDIGANMGFYTLLAGQHGDRVIGFEPHPAARDLLLRNIGLNGMMDDHIYRIGISDEETTAGVTDPYTFGTASLDPDGDMIDVRSLDQVRDQDELPFPDIVKIDVEGHELAVLRGMEDTLVGAEPILFIEAHQGDHDVKQFVQEHGYTWEPIMHRPDGNVLGRADPKQNSS
ncbi:MAG: FkbM family methyltransferase [Candidatus Nanohaloarchaeota archaeon QJJ-5]|nr:FkbM family methyltransferase [Candidatus Nanohaloarchaeota archaeon QJJ-5]